MGEASGEFGFGERLKYLQRRVPKPGGGLYTWQEIAEGVGISRPYLSELANGHRDQPSLHVAAALARFFDVSVDRYFLADAEQARRYANDIEFLATNKENDVSLAARANELDEKDRAFVADLIESLLAREKSEEEQA